MSQKEYVHLSKMRSEWIQQIIRPIDLIEQMKRSPRGLRYASDPRFKSKLYHFLDGSKGLEASAAKVVLDVLGVTEAQLELVDRLQPICARSGIKFDEKRFLSECAHALWYGKIGDREIDVHPISGAVLGLMDCVLARKKRFSEDEVQLVLGEMTDYLTESRDYVRWNKWISELEARLKCQGRVLYKDATRLFPTIDEFLSQDFDKVVFERSFAVRARGLRINYLRHQLYRYRRELLELKDRRADLPKEERGKLDVLINHKEEQIRAVHDDNGIRGLFASVKGPLTDFLIGVLAIKSRMPIDVGRRQFVYSSLRLLADWGKYHYSARDDAESPSVCALSLVHDVAAQYLFLEKNNRANGSWQAAPFDAMFPYLASIARLKLCNAVNRRKTTAERSAMCDMLTMAHEASLMNGINRIAVAAYRADRNLARCMVTAARWCLKTGRTLIYSNRKVDAVALMSKASKLWRENIVNGMAADERNATGAIVLRRKRALEHEFLLRVTIELLMADCDRRPDESDHEWGVRQASQFYEAFLIYAHLWPSTPRKLRDLVVRQLATHGEPAKITYFQPDDLSLTSQEFPPSDASKLESACAILYANFQDRAVDRKLLSLIRNLLNAHVLAIAAHYKRHSAKDVLGPWGELRDEPASDLKQVRTMIRTATGIVISEGM